MCVVFTFRIIFFLHCFRLSKMFSHFSASFVRIKENTESFINFLPVFFSIRKIFQIRNLGLQFIIRMGGSAFPWRISVRLNWFPCIIFVRLHERISTAGEYTDVRSTYVIESRHKKIHMCVMIVCVAYRVFSLSKNHSTQQVVCGRCNKQISEEKECNYSLRLHRYIFFLMTNTPRLVHPGVALQRPHASSPQSRF